jgi:hypothetical protein
MGKRSTWLGWVALCALGCSTTPMGARTATNVVEQGEATPDRAATPRLRLAGSPAPTPEGTGLPEAPWSGRTLLPEHVPPELLRAWARADNRARCAPMMPELVQGVAARAMALDGGWGVVFDSPGEAGITADGEPCTRCGLSAYGIAGTAATPDDWADLGPAHLEPRFRDGSLVELEPTEETGGALTATIVVKGQGCVYQLWTFLGEDHLSDLVGGLRRVAPPGPARVAGVRR